jgi:hypothetical protein
MWGLFSVGGLTGVLIGSNLAYRKKYERNKNPQYLEDYTARVAQHHGDFASWLVAGGAIFGSSSGFFFAPHPLNYGIDLALRSTAMKDENIQLGTAGGKAITGNATVMRWGVRDSLHELCRYAVGNPSERPAELELYAYHILGQVFQDKVTPEHIKIFVDEVMKVRSQFWQEDGIPKEKRKEAMAEMEKHFTKEGFEVFLEKLGLDAMQVDFLQLRGLVGKVSNLVTKNKVKHEEEEFHAKLEKRRAERSQASPVEEYRPMETPEKCPADKIAGVSPCEGPPAPEEKYAAAEGPRKPRDRVTLPASHADGIAKTEETQLSLSS